MFKKIMLLAALLLLSTITQAVVVIPLTNAPIQILGQRNGVRFSYAACSLPTSVDQTFVLSPEGTQWIESFRLVNAGQTVNNSKIPAVQGFLEILKKGVSASCLFKHPTDEKKSFVVQVTFNATKGIVRPEASLVNNLQVAYTDIRIYGSWPKSPVYLPAFVETCTAQHGKAWRAAQLTGLTIFGATATWLSVGILGNAYESIQSSFLYRKLTILADELVSEVQTIGVPPLTVVSFFNKDFAQFLLDQQETLSPTVLIIPLSTVINDIKKGEQSILKTNAAVLREKRVLFYVIPDYEFSERATLKFLGTENYTLFVQMFPNFCEHIIDGIGFIAKNPTIELAYLAPGYWASCFNLTHGANSVETYSSLQSKFNPEGSPQNGQQLFHDTLTNAIPLLVAGDFWETRTLEDWHRSFFPSSFPSQNRRT